MRRALAHLRKADPVLERLIAGVGPYRIRYSEPTFHALTRSIVFQQISGHAGAAIFGRLTAAGGDPLTPKAVMRIRADRMRTIGLSRQKAEYIADLARRTHKGEIDFDAFPEHSDEEVLAALTPVKGIGVWTVQMFLMFALRRPDVLPATDLGIRNAVQRAWRLPDPPKPKEIEALAARWHPYCSVASWYLWRSLEMKTPEAEAEGETEKDIGW